MGLSHLGQSLKSLAHYYVRLTYSKSGIVYLKDFARTNDAKFFWVSFTSLKLASSYYVCQSSLAVILGEPDNLQNPLPMFCKGHTMALDLQEGHT